MIQPFQNKGGGELGQNIMGPHLQEVTVGNQYSCIPLRNPGETLIPNTFIIHVRVEGGGCESRDPLETPFLGDH